MIRRRLSAILGLLESVPGSIAGQTEEKRRAVRIQRLGAGGRIRLFMYWHRIVFPDRFHARAGDAGDRGRQEAGFQFRRNVLVEAAAQKASIQYAGLSPSDGAAYSVVAWFG